MIVYLATFLGIIAILCKQSPFKLLPPPAPADGVGLNPLLQDPWMVIHPQVMFVGFASLSVPFSFAIAALWKKRWDGWIARTLPWALLTFLTLGTAILMGGYWAYKTLGWGGYWGWDPVENTSLVPWLFTAALVHGMFLQKAAEAPPQDQPHPRLHGLRDDPLRHVPDALRRPRRLLRALLHRPRHHGLARRDPGLVRGPLDRHDRVPVALDPDRRRGGDAAPVAERPLHPRHRRLLRARPRHPARDLGPAPHASLGHALAGPDVVLRRHDDAGGIPASAALRPRRLRLLEGRDAAGAPRELAPLPDRRRRRDDRRARIRGAGRGVAGAPLHGGLRGRHEPPGRDAQGQPGQARRRGRVPRARGRRHHARRRRRVRQLREDPAPDPQGRTRRPRPATRS